MNQNLRAKLTRAITAIAQDLKADPGDADGLILLDVDELLDTVIRVTTQHHSGTPLDELELPQRFRNALDRIGIRSIEQLTACTRDELLGTRNLGPAGITEITKALTARDLALADIRQDAKTKTKSAAAGECGDHDPPAAADFFQAGHTYIQAGRLANPTIFQCWSVATFPGTDALAGKAVAFGFTPSTISPYGWSIYIARRNDWTDGWTEYDETEATSA